jgi:hypothetical protein
MKGESQGGDARERTTLPLWKNNVLFGMRCCNSAVAAEFNSYTSAHDRGRQTGQAVDEQGAGGRLGASEVAFRVRKLPVTSRRAS